MKSNQNIYQKLQHKGNKHKNKKTTMLN